MEFRLEVLELRIIIIDGFDVVESNRPEVSELGIIVIDGLEVESNRPQVSELETADYLDVVKRDRLETPQKSGTI
jgi:hypothetical protein